MASNWDANWDDEEWLKKQNAAMLHAIFREANAQNKDSAKIKKVVVEKLHAVTDFKEVNSYDLLAFLNVANDADLTVTGADNQPRDLRAEMDSVIDQRTTEFDGKTDLISRLNRKALLEAAKITKKNDVAAQADLDRLLPTATVDASGSLMSAQTISDAEFDNFDNADKAGALDDVPDNVKNAFIDKLAELSKWDNVEGRIVEKNDNALLNAVTSLDVYKADGSLNDVYADCAELADKLTFEYPEGTTDAQKADLSKAYKQQLLANAAMRATNEVLKDRSFIMRHKTAEDILTAYKSEVAKQFERGVVVAGLTTHQATGIMLDKITRDKNTGEIKYDNGADDAVTQAIADILEGNSPINPLTVQMDTYQLDIENRKVETLAKRKKIATKLGFRERAKVVWNAAKANIIKKGGWKKIAVNVAVFGGAAAAMASGSGLVIGAGAALYAGMTTVNAWVMPAYDSLNNEMHEKKIKGFKARLAYLKQNFGKAMKAKRAEPGFKSRAWWRTAEGVAVGGLTGGMGLFGITGWTKVFSRQGLMTAGKGGSLIRSLFARNKAKKNMETTYSVDNFKALQTAESYLKQDKVALAAVIGGAVVADYFKYDFENGGPVAQTVGNIKALVSENSAAPVEATETPTVSEPKTSVAEVSEVKDEAGKVLETRTVTTDAEGNKIVEVKDDKGNVIGKGTQRWMAPSNKTETEITYEDGRKVTETVTAEGDKTVTTEYPNGVKTSQQVDAEGQVDSVSGTSPHANPVFEQTDSTTNTVPEYKPLKWSTFDPWGDSFKKMMDESKALVAEAGKLSDAEVSDLLAGAKENNLIPDDATVIVDGQKVAVSGLTPEQIKALPSEEQRLLLVSTVYRNQSLDSVADLKETVSPTEEVATDNVSSEAYQGETKLNSYGPYKLEEVNFDDYENLKPYNKADMGITFSSYKTLIRIYGAEELDRMLGALNREGVMDNFKDLGLTKEQLLVRFRGLDATTDRVDSRGFSIQGAVRYHHEEAMTYLNKLLGPCGDQITAEQYAVIKQSLAIMDNQGGYHGEGFVPTTSYHIRAHGYNTDDCGKGEYNQFKLGKRVNVVTQPVTPVTPVTPEPEVTPQDFSVDGGGVEGFINTAEAPEATEIKVNFTDPTSRATAYLANGSQDYDITGNIPEGAKYIRMDNHGNLYLWQKGAIVAGSENGNRVVSGAGGVESIHTTALNLKMDNLGAAEIRESTGGISFQYGKGKHALTFVLDKKTGEMHTFLGRIKDKNEIILDQATTARAATALTETMKESGLAAKYHLTFGAETEQNNHGLSDYIRDNDKTNVESDIDKDIAGAVRKAAKKGMATTQFDTPEVVPSYTPTGLTPEQNAALLSDKAVITATGIDKNGQMIFNVQGVEGVDRLAMPKLQKLSIAEGQRASVVVDTSRMGLTDSLHRSMVSVPAANGQTYTVEINTRGGAAQILDEQGKKVFLDKESSAVIGKACKDALTASGIKGVGNIDLNPYPEGSLGAKCVAAYNVFRQNVADKGSSRSRI